MSVLLQLGKKPDVAQSYNNLANGLRAQGNLKQAKEYHERGLAIRQQTLRSQHPDVAKVLITT